MRTEFLSVFKSGIFLIISLIVILLVLLPGCKNEPDQIGVDILPPSDDFSVFFDSTEIIEVNTHYGDSVRSISKSVQLLGSYADSIFGLSKAEIITQLEAPGLIPVYDPGDHVDSAVLKLYFADHYGDDGAIHQITVYEFTEKLKYDTSYFSSYSPEGKYLQEPIGTGMAYSNDSFIRVNITDMELLDRLMAAEDTVYNNSEMFLELVKGLYIKVEDQVSGGSILYTDLVDEQSVLTVYYRNDEDTLDFDFSMGWVFGLSINMFSHEYAGYPVEQYLINGSQNDSLVFIQGMAGLTGRIRFPQLESWRDTIALSGPVAINSADLVIIPEEGSLSDVEPAEYPVGLNLYWINEDGHYIFVYDYLLDETTFGGGYISDENLYSFDIKTQIQSYINGDIEENAPFILSAGNSANTLSYLILRGGNHSSSSRIRLELTYTKL